MKLARCHISAIILRDTMCMGNLKQSFMKICSHDLTRKDYLKAEQEVKMQPLKLGFIDFRNDHN